MAEDLVGRTLDVLRFRKRAYQLCFSTPKLVWRRLGWFSGAAFRAAFLQPAGQEVLIDLAKFCRASETCFNADPRLHAVAEGRREVWLRIANHLNLSSQQLYAIYTGDEFPFKGA